MQELTLKYVPAHTWEDAVRNAARAWGVQEDYWDIFGTHHVATPAALATVLRSMGVPADDAPSLNEALKQRLLREWANIVSPTIVVSASAGFIPVQIRADSPAIEIQAHFRWEHGGNASIFRRSDTLRIAGTAEIEGARFVRVEFPLPAEAPLGYHTVTVNGAEARCILCPDRAWKPDFLERGQKGAGVAISLYSVRSARNWGCGDFTDLHELSGWVADTLGASFVALNPLHSIPNRQPYNTSPYLPNCSFYRNGLYIDVDRLEDVRASKLARDLLASPRVQAEIAALREAPHVEYERVWALKRAFLKTGFREFLRSGSAARREEFRKWAEAEGDLLEKFAVYSALDEVLHKRDRNCWIWPDWAEHWRDPNSVAVRDFARQHRRLVDFFKYVQWQLDLQLAEAQRYARSRGLSIGLYHDLALATDRCGSDLWAHRRFYVEGCRVGSPPDDFSPKGQDWAFPPPNSACHYQDGYRQFAESIRKNCTHGGALRIDHVMRFFRLFWIPDGKEAADGVYVRDYAEDLLRILALESVRNRVLVIGEDLGTVEPSIREALARFGVLSYRLLYFEKGPDGSFKGPDEYPLQALVSVSTHDLPTLAGFWTGRDIEARRAAGVLGDEAAYREQWRSRQDEKQRMLNVMRSLRLLPEWFPQRAADVPEFTGELHYAAVGFLASTPSELMVLSGEDLFKQTDQQNLPGTTAQYPNWRGKLRFTLEELASNAEAVGCAQMFRYWLEKSGRLNVQPS